MSLTHFLATRLGLSCQPASRKKPLAARPRFRPMLEALEDRWVPSTLTVTNNLDSGAGSLRAEISAAHKGDTIVFAPSLDGQTITLTSGELLIKQNLTIAGPGAGQLTISGNNTSRVFEVAKGNLQVTLSGLTISNGLATNGAGIEVDAGGMVTVSNCTLSSNSQRSTNGSYAGGAIDNYGTLTVGSSTLSNNTSTGGGSGIANEAGATLTVKSSTLNGNSAAGGSGGGAVVNVGTATITGCTLSGNTASSAGAIFNDGVLSISGSTLSGNSANGDNGYYPGAGGAIQSGPPNQGAYQLTAGNCTFTNNSASYWGGAIFVNGSSGNLITGCTFGGAAGLGNSAVRGGAILDEGVLTLSGCTLSYNVAFTSGAQSGEGGGLCILSSGTVTVENDSSITNNTAPTGYGPDVYNLGLLYLDSTSTIGVLDS